MDHKQRDFVIRRKVLNEIADIESFVSDMTPEAFSEEYIERTSHIPWKAIRGMRNIAAHHYESIRIPNIWLTVCEDIPVLKQTLMDNE